MTKIKFDIVCRKCNFNFVFTKNVGPETEKVVAPCPECKAEHRYKMSKANIEYLWAQQEAA